MAVRVFVVEDAKPVQEPISGLLPSAVCQAQFGELRACLQALPGRVRETEAA